LRRSRIEVGDAGVLDLAVAEADLRRKAAHVLHGTEKVQQDLDAMAAEVHHGTAAGLGLPEQPGTRMARLRIEVLEGLHLGEDGLSQLA